MRRLKAAKGTPYHLPRHVTFIGLTQRVYIHVPTAASAIAFTITAQTGVAGVVTCQLDPDGDTVSATIPNPSDAGTSVTATTNVVLSEPTTLVFAVSPETEIDITVTVTP